MNNFIISIKNWVQMYAFLLDFANKKPNYLFDTP